MAWLRALLARPAGRGAWLALLVLALYWRTGEFAFLNYDDTDYVTKNDGVLGGLSWEGVRWAFTTGHAANWHPLTWLSHQLDVQLFDLNAGAHHRVNAVLHALNAALLYFALRALTQAPDKSALVAALFALHPLRVESVAWIAERKDLLAAGFAFACLWAYAGYARRGGARHYALALGLFALGLLSKPMLVTLPCVLLLLDAWPLKRLAAKRVWLEKLPFLALAAASSAITVVVQRAGGAFGEHERIGLAARVANAVHAYALYVWKTFWPSGLAVHHPHPALAEPAPSIWTAGVFVALAFLIAVTVFVVAVRRRAPYALVGWLWFLGTLVPVIGLLQVGLQGWAERYSYLPSVGLALALVWGLDALPRSLAQRNALIAGWLVVLGFTSARQLSVWRSDLSLFAHALAVEEANPVAHVQLGQALEVAQVPADAERHYRRALELRPSLAGVRVNLARVLEAGGRPQEAEAELARALAADETLGAAHASLGWLLQAQGRDTEALAHLRRALELAPADPVQLNNLAWVLATSRTSAAPQEALALAESLVAASSGAQAAYLETQAAALARLGRFAEASAAEQRALERVPAAYRAELARRLDLYRSGEVYLKSP